MKFTINYGYILTLFILWTTPIITVLWGWPFWTTVSIMAFFAIYAGHEWAHVLICSINGIEVESVSLASGERMHTLFLIDTDDKDRIKKESDIYLAGAVWDSVWFTVAIISTLSYSLIFKDGLSFVVSISLIIFLILNLAFPGSDWQEYVKRTTLRV